MAIHDLDRPPLLPDASAPVLAIDAGSPLISVAIGNAKGTSAEVSVEMQHSSRHVLSLVQAALERSRVRVSDVQLLVGLCGPGSFTGLRVGLATLVGISDSLEIPAVTMTNLEVLAALAPDGATATLACVDALKGDWVAQAFEPVWPPVARSSPRHFTADRLLAEHASHLIGFGISRLRSNLLTRSDVCLIEPGPLAGKAIELVCLGRGEWGPDRLTRPIYLRPPAAKRPPPRQRP